MWKKKALALAAVLVACGAAVAFARTQEKVVNKEVDFERHTFKALGTELAEEHGMLLLSDSPEYVKERVGVLAAGTLMGNSRVYFYHVNEAVEDRKIAILAKNKSNKVARVFVHRSFYAKPDIEYFEVGRELSKKDLQTKPAVDGKEIEIRPGGQVQLFTDLDKVKVRKGQLFSGILDFHTTEELYVKVMMIPFEYGVIGAEYTMSVLPMDEVELRGTYKGADRKVRAASIYNPSAGAAYIELATDREDAYVRGVDETTDNKKVVNKGNYGVSYEIDLQSQGEGTFDLFFNPQGGAYAGSIAIHSKKGEEIVDLPMSNRAHMGFGTIYETLHIGNYEAGEALQIRFMPAGASNLPVKLLLVPVKEEGVAS